jgi:hypothetical protein
MVVEVQAGFDPSMLDEEDEQAQLLAQMNAALAALTLQAGGRLVLRGEFLDSIVGQGVRMHFDEANGDIVLETFSPLVSSPEEDLMPMPTHEMPTMIH